MPFATDFDNVFYAIKAVAEKLRVNAERADRPVDQQRITDRILRTIRHARLVIADITNLKPNVMYEIGYAHAIGKPVFLLTQEDISSVPFDIKDYNVLRYAFPVNLRVLEGELKDHISSALERATGSLVGPLTQALESVESIRPNNDLYATIVGVCLEDVATRAAKWTNGEIRVGPAETIDKGIEVFRHLSSGGFATSLVKIDDYWNSNGQYYEECRNAALRGRRIERVFILSETASIDNASLRSHIEQDHAAGIKTYIAFDLDILDKDSVRDFGIWDDEVVCCVDTRTEHGQSVPTGCTFSKTAAELSTARRWRTAIMQEARPADEVLDELDRMGEVQRLLRVSAPIMAKKALESCAGDVVDREDCTWYHQAWQYLRALDLVSTPDWHSEFFSTALGRCMAPVSQTHVLICGAADYGMLQQVWSAARSRRINTLDITVVDLCLTPLRMCEWYSDRSGFRISTHQADALDLGLLREGGFDLIVTDAFLSRFTTNAKQKVVNQWCRLLKRGGRVVTTARIAGTSAKVVGSKNGVDDFVNRAKETFRRERWLWIKEDEVESLARGYASHIASYPFQDTQEVQRLFTSNGMSVLELEQRNTKGELHPNTVYARVLAEFT